MSDLGEMMGRAIMAQIVIIAVIAFVLGVALAIGIPWLWHFAAAHISFH